MLCALNGKPLTGGTLIYCGDTGANIDLTHPRMGRALDIAQARLAAAAPEATPRDPAARMVKTLMRADQLQETLSALVVEFDKVAVQMKKTGEAIEKLSEALSKPFVLPPPPPDINVFSFAMRRVKDSTLH
jgi:hypothetical protein